MAQKTAPKAAPEKTPKTPTPAPAPARTKAVPMAQTKVSTRAQAAETVAAPAAASPVAEAIRAAVTRRKLTAYAVGKLAGVDERQVKRFLDGKRDLTLASADKLVAALGLRLVAGATRKGRTRRRPRTRAADDR